MYISLLFSYSSNVMFIYGLLEIGLFVWFMVELRCYRENSFVPPGVATMFRHRRWFEYLLLFWLPRSKTYFIELWL